MYIMSAEAFTLAPAGIIIPPSGSFIAGGSADDITAARPGIVPPGAAGSVAPGGIIMPVGDGGGIIIPPGASGGAMPGPGIPSGVRIGTPAATMRGLDDDDMREVGAIILEALDTAADLKALRERTRELMAARPLYPAFAHGYSTI